MMKYLTVFIFIFVSHANAQRVGIYRVNTIRYPFSCDLILYESGRYVLNLEVIQSEDMIEVVSLSYGTYSKIDSVVTLKDTPYGFTLNFTYNKKSLIGFKIFDFLRMKTFDLNSTIDESEPNYLSVKRDCSCTKLKRENGANCSGFKISSGVYDSGNGYLLTLSKNFDFEYSYHGFVLLVGKWYCDKNFLYLTDKTLTHDFCVRIIGSNELQSEYLPGDFKGLKFKKSQR